MAKSGSQLPGRFESVGKQDETMRLRHLSSNINRRVKDYVNLQLTWILIGNPADIGIFDKNTLNIAVICSENTSFTFQNDRTDLIARLKIEINIYAPGTIKEHETSESEVENTSENEVEDTIEDNNENEAKDNLCEYSLDWCIILPENEVKNENDSTCLPITMTHLKAIGQYVYTQE
ncbi:hypothetical protein C2G38_2228980 [Gigaspora rosea]|uniref:Uncharacterized protein n=1 Tax=Gigaspora rosea TaxID=44941 RepID=A0A397U4R4_9GLOM|nr:hypothetical protein C2G38_2228980 [Gigaspora rosea]